MTRGPKSLGKGLITEQSAARVPSELLTYFIQEVGPEPASHAAVCTSKYLGMWKQAMSAE